MVTDEIVGSIDSLNGSFFSQTPALERPMGGESEQAQEYRSSDLEGLSNSHIRPRLSITPTQNKIIYHPGGQLIQVKQPRGSNRSRKKESKRGIIQTFSFRSRRRMMTMAAKLDKEMLPLFVTLTYPEIFPSSQEAKRHLKVFIQRLKRIWPDIGYMWKLEFQKRGAPHFHMFLWGVEFFDAFSQISGMWYEVCGSNDERHLRAGTKVEKIKHRNGITKYASKYLGKIIEEESPEGLGRVWGCGGNIPVTEGKEYLLTKPQTHKILRRLRKRIKTKKKSTRKSIRSFYVPHPEYWLDRHGELTGDDIPF